MLAAASDNGQSFYILTYVILGVLTLILVPSLGFFCANLVKQVRSNTQSTDTLAATVGTVVESVKGLRRDVDRHERILERAR